MKFSKYNLVTPSVKENHFYLFNTYGGACFEVDSTIADIIKNARVEDLQEETKDLFALSGVIIADNVNEDHVLAYMHGRHKYDTAQYSSTVILTWGCNLRCTYCFQDHDKAAEAMTMEQAEKYIKFTLETIAQNRARSVHIVLFGGEPLINIDVGFYILEKIKSFCDLREIGFNSTIVTNGTLLDAQKIKKLHGFNCRTVQVTIDGKKEIHDKRRMYACGKGSFDETMAALRLLNKESEMHAAIRISIDKTNIKDTYELLDHIGKDGGNLTNCIVDFGIVRAESKACAGYASNCLTETEIGDVLFDLWNYAAKQGFRYNARPQRRYIHCSAYCENFHSVTPNLDVYKCLEHVRTAEHLMGRIDENGRFVDQTPAYYEWMSVDPFKNDACKECVYMPNCFGGCGVMAYNKTGSYQAEGCFKVKGVLEKQVVKYVEGVMARRQSAKE